MLVGDGAVSSFPYVGLLQAHGGLTPYLPSTSLCWSVCALLAQKCWVCRRGLTVLLAVAGASHIANIKNKKND